MSAPALVACAAAALLIGLPVVSASGALEARQRAAGAADGAALAAADAANGWIDAEPCTLAAQITGAAGATLTGCTIDPSSGTAQVSASVTTLFGSVTVFARAGPPGIEYIG